MKDSSHDFSQLSPVKQQLLQKLLQKKQAGRSAPSSQMIQHYPGQEEAPLSFAQQRLWFLEQLDTSSSPYYVPFAGQLKGPLHLEILEKSIQGIVSRHAALRTVFVNQNDHPVQVVRPTLDLMVPMIDLRWLSAPEQESQIHRLTREEIQQPFDLAQGPLLRVTLLRLKNDEHFLLVTFHHIVTDGWSSSIQQPVPIGQAPMVGQAQAGGDKPQPLRVLTVSLPTSKSLLRPYPAYRSNTPTLLDGNGSGCKARSYRNNSTTGGTNWQALHHC